MIISFLLSRILAKLINTQVKREIVVISIIEFYLRSLTCGRSRKARSEAYSVKIKPHVDGV